MAAPDDRRYLKSHEWHRREPDGLIAVGISQFAVEELTDITYVEVTRDEGSIEAGEVFGEVESVKATSELYCGIGGTVVAVNQQVIDKPETLNEDCYDAGWIIKIRPADPAEFEKLLSAADYDKACGQAE
ncbi:MAG: glycine cleavage system protein GcvH [Phycisphaeraceae bacterium]|nr:glycine cleavage system protein GcvH [Phycisphaeraceae bacterium]